MGMCKVAHKPGRTEATRKAGLISCSQGCVGDYIIGARGLCTSQFSTVESWKEALSFLTRMQNLGLSHGLLLAKVFFGGGGGTISKIMPANLGCPGLCTEPPS